MNKFTIILLTSFLTLIQIANALPVPGANAMHEAAIHREPIKDNAPEPTDDQPIETNDSPVECTVGDEDAGGEVIDDDQGNENGQENTNGDDSERGEKGTVSSYRNMEHLVHEAIRDHLGHHFEFDSMSAETEQQLYEMFCEMEIIPADERI
ncbi:uncharacterized protein LOC119072231 [Bradysia coprophila]|uniref:uncharacterized protein LOC119072231 n=1 Tax=Bradysia coprophila TaxID=38358 RepID=UPI00187DA7CB|nr:uncharacterized protein LOC119072231 [Bradysia coprophila]